MVPQLLHRCRQLSGWIFNFTVSVLLILHTKQKENEYAYIHTGSIKTDTVPLSIRLTSVTPFPYLLPPARLARSDVRVPFLGRGWIYRPWYGRGVCTYGLNLEVYSLLFKAQYHQLDCTHTHKDTGHTGSDQATNIYRNTNNFPWIVYTCALQMSSRARSDPRMTLECHAELCARSTNGQGPPTNDDTDGWNTSDRLSVSFFPVAYRTAVCTRSIYSWLVRCPSPPLSPTGGWGWRWWRRCWWWWWW